MRPYSSQEYPDCMSLLSYSLLPIAKAYTSYTLALSISVIAHPPLLSRIILSAIFAPLGSIFTLLPFPHCSRIALRIASSSLGAFGVVLSIALFRRNLAWGDIWDRLYLHDSLAWGTSTERGLSAAYCLLFLSGMAVDWYLHRRIGENPDEVRVESILYSYSHLICFTHNRNGTATFPSTLMIFPILHIAKAPSPPSSRGGTSSSVVMGLLHQLYPTMMKSYLSLPKLTLNTVQLPRYNLRHCYLHSERRANSRRRNDQNPQ